MDTGTEWHLWGLAELEGLPVISQGHSDNLMVDTEIGGTRVRVWLCRMGIADGAPYDHGVTVQTLQGGDWATVAEYPAATVAAEDEEDDDEPQTYRIVRFFQRDDLGREVIATGLTLEEAQGHCEDPETSSSTATGPEAAARTAECGAWFDGWNAE